MVIFLFAFILEGFKAGAVLGVLFYIKGGVFEEVDVPVQELRAFYVEVYIIIGYEGDAIRCDTESTILIEEMLV